MPNNKLKRKRTPNFSMEEKLTFVSLLCEKGQCILSKVRNHDACTNKEKEEAWATIAQIHNSGGDFVRTPDNLKKLWSKLKSEAKTYKAAIRPSANGSGVGPVKKIDDPVLELVVDIISRASTDNVNIEHCDDDDADISATENPTSSPLPVTSKSIKNLDNYINPEHFQEDKTSTSDMEEVQEIQKTTKKDWFNRRSDMNTSNERIDQMLKQQKISISIAVERLRGEREKTKLLQRKFELEAELHRSKLKNEKLKKETENLKLSPLPVTSKSKYLDDYIKPGHFLEDKTSASDSEEVQEVQDEEPKTKTKKYSEINTSNGRTDQISSQQRISMRIAAERLRAEQEKTKLIQRELEQNAELHRSKTEFVQQELEQNAELHRSKTKFVQQELEQNAELHRLKTKLFQQEFEQNAELHRSKTKLFQQEFGLNVELHRSKTKLIQQELAQNSELHRSKLDNERLKKELLQTLLKKVLDADSKEDVAKIVTKYVLK